MATGQTLHQRSSNMNAIDSHSILFKCCPQLPFCLLNMGLFLHAKAAVCYRGNCVLASSNIIPLEVSQAMWCRPVTHTRTHTPLSIWDICLVFITGQSGSCDV